MKCTKRAIRPRTSWNAWTALAVVMLGVAGLGVSPARGAETGWFTFVNDCANGFTCTGTAGLRTCWCELDWDDNAYWQLCTGATEGTCTDQDPPVSFPEHTYERVTIEHSSTDSRCDGGLNAGNLCTMDSNCDVCEGGSNDGNSCAKAGAAACTSGGGTCSGDDCEPEQYLLINLTKDASSNPITISTFTIKPESSGSLDIRFESFDASNTLTTIKVTIDGTNGDVEMRVSDSAEVKTQ